MAREPKPDYHRDQKFASVEPTPTRRRAILSAIKDKRLVRYQVSGQEPQEAEPHIYGARGGIDTLLVYKVFDGSWDAWTRLGLNGLRP
jgi:hypothetical protein